MLDSEDVRNMLTCRPRELERAACRLIHRRLPDSADDVDTLAVRLFDWPDLYVCGHAPNGITLAYEIANQLGATAIFTEPVYDTGLVPEYSQREGVLYETLRPDMVRAKKVGQQLKFKIPKNATILFVDVTTDKIGEMISCIDGLDAVVPYVLCLTNKSDLSEIEVQCQTSYGPNECKFGIVSLAEIPPLGQTPRGA